MEVRKEMHIHIVNKADSEPHVSITDMFEHVAQLSLHCH